MKWVKLFNSLQEAENRVLVNHTVRVKFSDKILCIAHTPKGWFAIDDHCPHMGESLSKGSINYLNEITCPWHSHRFSLEHGHECEGRSPDAETYEIEIREDGVYLAF